MIQSAKTEILTLDPRLNAFIDKVIESRIAVHARRTSLKSFGSPGSMNSSPVPRFLSPTVSQRKRRPQMQRQTSEIRFDIVELNNGSLLDD